MTGGTEPVQPSRESSGGAVPEGMNGGQPSTAAGRRPAAAIPVGRDAAALRLGMVLQLAHRARRASRDELPFIIANETRQLLAYRQSALWTVQGGEPRLAALSGLAMPDMQSPYVAWMQKFAKWRLAKHADGEPGGERMPAAAIALPALAVAEGTPSWLAEWAEWIPGYGLEAVLFGPGGWVCGYVCLFRDTEFTESEAALFGHLAENYGDSLGGSQMRPGFRAGKMNFWRMAGVAVALLFIAAMLVPRPQTALAPAEVAARRPALVRAGVEGVVESFLVEPNQEVREGQPLLRLEDTQLRTRLAVAEKAAEMARTELRQLQEAALHDAKAKPRLPLARGRVEQLEAEAAYVGSLLERVVATSPMNGVALLDNPDEWLGRPVGLGQKIMMVADPGDVMLEIFLPAAETMPLSSGDELLFFPNIAPASPLRARIVFVGYRAVDTPGIGLALPLRAEFVGTEQPMLGLRGTARLHGEPLPLGLIILRRPIMAVRQWLGW